MIKRFIIILLIFLSAFLFFCNGRSKESKDNKADTSASTNIPKITASVDRSRVSVGDLIDLKLNFNLPEGSNLSETDITGLEGLTIVGKKSGSREIDFTLLADKTASFNIGPVSLSFKDSKGVLNIIRTDVLHIDVLSNLGNNPADAGLKTIMDIITTYPLWLTLLPWMFGLLLLCAIGAGIYYWKKKKTNEDELKKSLIPPHVAATDELNKLIAMNLIDRGQYKEFYFRFSEILRVYLEKLRGFPAAEFTTEEISRRVAGTRVFQTEDRKLVDILRDADLVKFSDSVPLKAKNEDDIRAALDYINATKPVDLTPRPPLPKGEGEK